MSVGGNTHDVDCDFWEMVKVGGYRLMVYYFIIWGGGGATELQSPTPDFISSQQCSSPLLSKWWNHNVLMKKSHSRVFGRAARVIREDWWRWVVPPRLQAAKAETEGLSECCHPDQQLLQNQVLLPSQGAADCLRGCVLKKHIMGCNFSAVWRRPTCSKLWLRWSWPSCTSVGVYRHGVALRKSAGGGKKVPTAFSSPLLWFLFLCIISVSWSLSFALKSNQLPGFLFMSPGSDALASKLCKCILPAKLKPSLLVLRGLLHTVLHHFFGSGPYISHRNETADGFASSLPSHLPTCLSCLSGCLSLWGPERWDDVCGTAFN